MAQDRKQYLAAYYIAHKLLMDERHSEWQRTHAEVLQERNLARYHQNKDSIREYQKQYRLRKKKEKELYLKTSEDSKK